MTLGRIFGLAVSATPSAFAAHAVLWFALALVVHQRLKPGFGKTIWISGVAIGLHILTILVHHFGHALAAHSVGHPMIGIRLWGLLGTSVYPEDEAALPDFSHLRRAVGGPVLSLIFVAVIARLHVTGPSARFLKAWLLVDNALGFVLGALLPLNFTDGGTIRRYWPLRLAPARRA